MNNITTNSINLHCQSQSPLTEHIANKSHKLGKMTRDNFQNLNPTLKKLMTAILQPSRENLEAWIKSKNPVLLLNLCISDKLSHSDSIKLLNSFNLHLNSVAQECNSLSHDECIQLFTFASDFVLNNPSANDNQHETSIFESILCDPYSSLSDIDAIKSFVNSALLRALQEIEVWQGFTEISDIVNLSIYEFDLKGNCTNATFEMEFSCEFECVGYPSKDEINFYEPLQTNYAKKE